MHHLLHSDLSGGHFINGTVKITLFGNLRVTVAGHPVATINTARLQSLLAWLILQGSSPQPRERAAALLWPESSSAQARTNLRQLLHHLKRALPPECKSFLKGDHFAVSWENDASCSIDTVQFELAASRAAEARDRNHPSGELGYLEAAATLYVDDLLPTLYDPWLTSLRQNLRAQFSGVLYRLTLLSEQSGQIATAIRWASRLVAQDLLAEPSYHLLMRLHVLNHDRASALRTYHQLKVVLRRELGVAPGPEMVTYFERILKSNPPLPEGERRSAQSAQPRSLVGRLPERQLLHRTWEAVALAGARALVISGEPGIGKTRLAEELLREADASGCAVARARCYSGRGQLAYAPVVAWLRTEPLRTAWAKLPSFQLSELARLVPEIRESHPAASDMLLSAENWQRAWLFEALNAAIGRCQRPLLLFLDDLQWCDAESLEWICLLLGSAAANQVLLLATVRSEEIGRDHPLQPFLAELRRAGLMTKIALEPLDAAETIELARQESTEPLVVQQLKEMYQTTKGNPLFVLESVRAGVSGARVHAVISARFANLSTGTYELAGLASIVGRPFSFELLEKASDWDEHSLTLALDELWQRRIIEGSGGACYDFTHDRLRDVARSELSLVRTRYLHRRVARALAELHSHDSQEWNGQIASHYELADMPEQAIEHLWSAAVSARARFAYRDAAALLTLALRLCSNLPEPANRSEQVLDLLLLLGTVLVTTEGYPAADVGRTYGRALEIARRLGSRKLFASLSGLWVFHLVGGNVETSRQQALEFLEAAEKEASSDLRLAAHFLLGSSLCHLGQMESSLLHLTIALDAHDGPSDSALEVFGGSDVRVFCRAYLSHVAWHRAPQDEDGSAEILIAEAMHAADQMGHPFIRAIALNYAALLHALRGDSGAALKVGRAAIQLCDENAFTYYLAMANVVTAWAMAIEGETTAGLEQFRLGLDSMRRLGAELRLPFYYALLGQAYVRAGFFREASASLSSGFAFASKNGEEWAVAELHQVQGDLLVTEGKLEQAVISYGRGVDSARRCGSLAMERSLVSRLQEVSSKERS